MKSLPNRVYILYKEVMPASLHTGACYRRLMRPDDRVSKAMASIFALENLGHSGVATLHYTLLHFHLPKYVYARMEAQSLHFRQVPS